jgi:hypothetical protein
MVTRAECIAAAARIYVEGCRVRDSLPVEEAARRAYTPTGPSIPELERMIRAQRGLTEQPVEAEAA